VSIYDFRLPIADLGKRRTLTVFWKIPVRNRQSQIINRKCSRRGLSLIEVMLAVVILGIGSGVLLLATARCLAIVTKSQRYSTAQRLILRVGAEYPLARAEVDAGIKSGTFDYDDGYRWEREITEPESKEREGLFTVRTRVSWSDRGRDSFEEITTWHFIPPPEEDK
jgi:prepilin-type N-terminal cleavage/methylation domain-containing protein